MPGIQKKIKIYNEANIRNCTISSFKICISKRIEHDWTRSNGSHFRTDYEKIASLKETNCFQLIEIDWNKNERLLSIG